MLPLLSLHAMAAQRGDGLHPLLLAGLSRLVGERAEHAATDPARERAKPAADWVKDAGTAKPMRAA